jgi:hypothetical protein
MHRSDDDDHIRARSDDVHGDGRRFAVAPILADARGEDKRVESAERASRSWRKSASCCGSAVIAVT